MRAKNIGKNSFFSVFSQALIILAGFFSQRVINLKLGAELVGLNGVISNVIAVFSVTELGMSTAIVFHLYRALAEGKEEKIAALMNLYRRVYEIVAGVITLLGLGFLPFLHNFLRENHFSLGYVRMIYALWLIKTVLGYLLSYKRSIVIADQREYVASLATLGISLFHYCSVIVIASLWGKFEWALVFSIGFEALVNLGLIAYVNARYPFLRRYRRHRLEPGVVQSVFLDVRNLFVTRIAQKLLGCTDNLILSSFISLGIVGLYSNYCLITQSLINVMQALSGALQPTVGNLLVEGDRERDRDLLHVFTFVFFFFTAIITCGVTGMASLFVGNLWLGESFRLSDATVYFMAINCMLYILTLPISAFVSVSGLFQYEKKVAMAAAVVNLALSLLLVRPLGLPGVLTGTLVAYLILIIGKTVGLHKFFLQMPAGKYLTELAQYVLLTAAEALLCGFVARGICQGPSLLRFALATCLCVLIPAGSNFLLFFRSRRFGNMLRFFKKYRSQTKKESV